MRRFRAILTAKQVQFGSIPLLKAHCHSLGRVPNFRVSSSLSVEMDAPKTSQAEEGSSNTTEDSLSSVLEKLEPLSISSTSKELSKPSRLATGLVYDEFMTKHCDKGGHPECPERVTSIYQWLQAQGLVSQCSIVPAREATTEELATVHSSKHIERVVQYSKMEQNFDADTYMNKFSSTAANLAAGGLIELTRKVAAGELQNGFAVIRPPGHHAECHTAMGFCLYNNVAVAAQVILNESKKQKEEIEEEKETETEKEINKGNESETENKEEKKEEEEEAKEGDSTTNTEASLSSSSSTTTTPTSGIERILIVDWDVHHGNGTQNMFYQSSNVLFISLHRFGGFYPGTGKMGEVGKGEGEGYNINIPFSGNFGFGDKEYLYAFEQVVMPIARQYQPDLVLVSSGFDAAEGDPLGGMKLTPYGYSRMTKELMTLAGGKVVLALEGGYSLKAISYAAEACVRALLGDPKEVVLVWPEKQLKRQQYTQQKIEEKEFKKQKTFEAARQIVARVKEVQKKYWACLREEEEVEEEKKKKKGEEKEGEEKEKQSEEKLAQQLEAVKLDD
jgi:acetoin utilization deacetylase AcuC-like enzyme